MQGTDTACGIWYTGIFSMRKNELLYFLLLHSLSIFFKVFVSIIVFNLFVDLFLTENPALALVLFCER